MSIRLTTEATNAQEHSTHSKHSVLRIRGGAGNTMQVCAESCDEEFLASRPRWPCELRIVGCLPLGPGKVPTVSGGELAVQGRIKGAFTLRDIASGDTSEHPRSAPLVGRSAVNQTTSSSPSSRPSLVATPCHSVATLSRPPPASLRVFASVHALGLGG
jgi:hypothetical protein